MDKAGFEDGLRRDGYAETVARAFRVDHDRTEHAHDYDVRAMVVEGEITLDIGGVSRTCRSGDVFEVARGVRHSEIVGPSGVSFVAGRRR